MVCHGILIYDASWNWSGLTLKGKLAFQFPTQNNHCERTHFEFPIIEAAETCIRNREMDFSDEKNFSCSEYTFAFDRTRRGWRMPAFFNSGKSACHKRFLSLRCMYFCATWATLACWMRGVCPRPTWPSSDNASPFESHDIAPRACVRQNVLFFLKDIFVLLFWAGADLAKMRKSKFPGLARSLSSQIPRSTKVLRES